MHGRVRYIEHHGHESLAFLDIGAYAVPVDDINAAPPPTTPSGTRLSRVAGLFRRGTRIERAAEETNGDGTIFAGPPVQTGTGISPQRGNTTLLDPPGRHHRAKAEVAVRLAPYPSLRVGDQLSVAVRIDQLHFFDGRGQRIDVGWR